MEAQAHNSLLLFTANEFIAPTSDSIYWKEIYNGETIRAGYYHLKSGAKDDQTPHDYDEVYWIGNGVASISIGKENFRVKKGDIIFVQAKQVHYFHDITEDLNLLVLFSKGLFDSKESISQINHIDQLMLSTENNKNVWFDFLNKKSMTLGLYRLAKNKGGDKQLTHPFDEINFVVKGEGRFTAGDQKIEVRPGSLFFVSKETPHYFETTEGIDVLVLSEKKSVK